MKQKTAQKLPTSVYVVLCLAFATNLVVTFIMLKYFL